MNSWGRAVMILSVLGSLTAGTGCALFVAAGAGATAGAGAAEYIRGELKQAYAASMEKAWKASLAAAEELEMTVSEKSIDNMDRNRLIKGKTGEGRDFQIALESVSPEVTMVKVRIGVFGDEIYSRKVQEKVGAQMKKQ